MGEFSYVNSTVMGIVEAFFPATFTTGFSVIGGALMFEMLEFR